MNEFDLDYYEDDDCYDEDVEFEESVGEIAAIIAVPVVVVGLTALCIALSYAELKRGLKTEKAIENYYHKKDSRFKPFTLLKLAEYDFNRLDKDTTDFDYMFKNRGKEIAGNWLAKFFGRLGADSILYVWSYGSEPICMALDVSETIQTVHYVTDSDGNTRAVYGSQRIAKYEFAIHKKYAAYKKFYTAAMAMTFQDSIWHEGVKSMLQLKDQIERDEPTAFLEYEIETIGLDKVFTESSDEKKDKKDFQKKIGKACSLTYTLLDYNYGVEVDGHLYNVDRSEYQKYYHYLSKEEFFKAKGGICYDYTNVLNYYLVNNGYKPKLFYMEIVGSPINHTFIMIPFTLPSGRTKYLYCEPSKKLIGGCYSTFSMEDLITSIVYVFRQEFVQTKNMTVEVREFEPVRRYGISYNEMLKELRKGKIFMQYVLKPFASRGGSTSGSASRSNIASSGAGVDNLTLDPHLLHNINPEIERIG